MFPKSLNRSQKRCKKGKERRLNVSVQVVVGSCSARTHGVKNVHACAHSCTFLRTCRRVRAVGDVVIKARDGATGEAAEVEEGRLVRTRLDRTGPGPGPGRAMAQEAGWFPEKLR